MPTPINHGHRPTSLPRTNHDTISALSASKRDAPEIEFGLDYHLKQYGTDTLVGGGAIAAGVFMFAPEPLVTKIIGGSIALSCIVAGGVGKHFIYRGAYIHEALEKAMNKLDGQVETLDTEIRILRRPVKAFCLPMSVLPGHEIFSRGKSKHSKLRSSISTKMWARRLPSSIATVRPLRKRRPQNLPNSAMRLPRQTPWAIGLSLNLSAWTRKRRS